MKIKVSVWNVLVLVSLQRLPSAHSPSCADPGQRRCHPGTSCSQRQQGPLENAGLEILLPLQEEGVGAACSTPLAPWDASQLLPGKEGSGSKHVRRLFVRFLAEVCSSGWWSLSYCCEVLDTSGFILSPPPLQSEHLVLLLQGSRALHLMDWRAVGREQVCTGHWGCPSLWSTEGEPQVFATTQHMKKVTFESNNSGFFYWEIDSVTFAYPRRSSKPVRRRPGHVGTWSPFIASDLHSVGSGVGAAGAEILCDGEVVMDLALLLGQERLVLCKQDTCPHHPPGGGK